MQVASSGHWSPVDPNIQPLTPEETIRQRLTATWVKVTVIVGALLVVATFVPVYLLLRTSAPTMLDVLIALVVYAAFLLVPVNAVVFHRVLQKIGAQASVYQVWPMIMRVRDGARWRYCVVRRPAPGADVLPTTATLEPFLSASDAIQRARIVSLALRGALGVIAIAIAGVLGVSMVMFVLLLFVSIGLICMSAAQAVHKRMDQRLTPGAERPETLRQQAALIAVRSAMVEGTRPAELTDTYVTDLLAPDVHAVPILNYTAAYRSSAHVLAAYCLIDSQRFDEAEQVLRNALAVTARPSQYIQLEAHYALAWLIARQGGDSNEARMHLQKSRTNGCERFELYAFEALIAYRAGDTAQAIAKARASLNSMNNPLYRGHARSVEAVMEDLLQRAVPASE